MDIYLMVGNVGTGKSTLAKNLAKAFDFIVWNNDDFSHMLSGNNDFGAIPYGFIKKMLHQFIECCIEFDKECIIDQTNMSIKTRRRVISMFQHFNRNTHQSKDLNFIAYDFGCGDVVSLNRRINDGRGISTGKWLDVHEKFKLSYQKPTKEEGFKHIMDVK